MSIRPSAAADIARLMTEFTSGDLRRHQLAAARLAVIGSRAASPLLGVAADETQPPATRVAALEVLESITEPRAVALATRLATSAGSDEVASAALLLLGGVARGTDARATKALDVLAAVALDATAASGRRLAALSALDGQPPAIVQPLYDALAADPASRVVARVTRQQAGAQESLDALVAAGLSAAPDLVAATVRDEAERTALSTLKKAVDLARTAERAATAADRPRGSAVRGALHQQLAARGSRLALYDLRETLEDASAPLPVGFLSAVAVVGDATCLVPLARAWTMAEPDDRWWREHLADAFRAIVTRDGLTRRHATLKQILETWPSAGPLVALARR
jgi:hypothetical protein